MPVGRETKPTESRRSTEHCAVVLRGSGAEDCLLFCFHHAGGGASLFRNWPRLLDPEIGAATVQLPGRETSFGAPLWTDPETTVERLCAEIAQHTDRPYVLLGHSLGAMLAFEIAAAFGDRCARPPSGLVVSGQPPLHLRRVDASAAGKLSDERLLTMLGQYGGTPKEVLNSPDLLRLLLPVVRADFQLAETYCLRAGRRVSCPILILAGREDTATMSHNLKQWNELTPAGVTVEMFDGDHFFIRKQEVAVCQTVSRFVLRYTKGNRLVHVNG